MFKKILSIFFIASFSILFAGCHSVTVQQTNIGHQTVTTLKRDYPIYVASQVSDDYSFRRTSAYAEKFLRVFAHKYTSKVIRGRHPESLKDALSAAYKSNAKYLFYLEIPHRKTNDSVSSGNPLHAILEVSVYDPDSGRHLMRKELSASGNDEHAAKQTEVAVKAFCRQIFR
jgi:hypothetical protein